MIEAPPGTVQSRPEREIAVCGARSLRVIAELSCTTRSASHSVTTMQQLMIGKRKEFLKSRQIPAIPAIQ